MNAASRKPAGQADNAPIDEHIQHESISIQSQKEGAYKADNDAVARQDGQQNRQQDNEQSSEQSGEKERPATDAPGLPPITVPKRRPGGNNGAPSGLTLEIPTIATPSGDGTDASGGNFVAERGFTPLGELSMLPSPLVADASGGVFSALQAQPTSAGGTGFLPSDSPLSRTSSLRRPVPVDATRKYVPLYDASSKRIVSEYTPPPRRATGAGAGPAGILSHEARLPPLQRFAPRFVLKRSTSSEGLGEIERLHRERSQYVPAEPVPTKAPGEEADDEPRLGEPAVIDKGPVYTTRGPKGERQAWREERPIGTGAFSRVVLARPDISSPTDVHVAIKITDFAKIAPKEQARTREAIRRELDILATLRHPSLVRLLGARVDDEAALLVLPHSAGGDMFDLAASVAGKMGPTLVQRLFAEVARAVAYLHASCVVHRDIKLENVLVNLPADELLALQDPHAYPRPLITLTDFGLSKRIDPANPLLTTRCGSEDYVPPELLMGQPYDGRQTDSWALGVLLYAVLENRLPFDPPQGVASARARGRTAHRIARVEWSWIKLKGDTAYDPRWDGAKAIVEGCLQKRTKRLLASEIVDLPWVRDGIAHPLQCDEVSPVAGLFSP